MKTRQTIFRGIAKARKGSPAISLQTVIERSKKAGVTNEEAIEAAELLSKKRHPLRHAEAGAVSGLLGPGISAAGRATQALVDAKKGRWGAARKALTNTTRGGVAADVMRGALFGGGISAGRESVQLQRAKDTYQDFMRQHGTKKMAGLGNLVARLRAQGFDPGKEHSDRALGIARRYADDLTRPARTPQAAAKGASVAKEERDKEAEAAEALIQLMKMAFNEPTAPKPPSPPTPKTSISQTTANKASRTGRFKGVATQNSLKPPGPAVSKIAINPRRNVTQAINAFRS